MACRGPRCSILLPVRDAGRDLDACLRSIGRQTEADYQVVAVDDGSTDGSRDRLERWAAEDPRVELIDSPGRGLVAALNAGLSRCEAPIVCRMDADDVMTRDRLAVQLDHLDRHPDTAVVGSRVRIFPRRTLQAGYRAYEQWMNALVTPQALALALDVEAPLAHPSVCFRRAPVLGLGGYRDGDFPEDYDLWLRCRRAGLGLGKVPRVLLAWRDHPGRTSRRSPRYARSAFARLRADSLAVDERLRGRPLVIWGAGKHARRFVRLLLERKVGFERWIDIDPRKVGRELLDRPITSPEGFLAGRRGDELMLVLVTNHGARAEIASWLGARELTEGRDFIHVGT